MSELKGPEDTFFGLKYENRTKSCKICLGNWAVQAWLEIAEMVYLVRIDGLLRDYWWRYPQFMPVRLRNAKVDKNVKAVDWLNEDQIKTLLPVIKEVLASEQADELLCDFELDSGIDSQLLRVYRCGDCHAFVVAQSILQHERRHGSNRSKRAKITAIANWLMNDASEAEIDEIARAFGL
jgi:hypothetical protein